MKIRVTDESTRKTISIIAWTLYILMFAAMLFLSVYGPRPARIPHPF